MPRALARRHGRLAATTAAAWPPHSIYSRRYVPAASAHEPRLPPALHRHARVARGRLVSHRRTSRSGPSAHRLGDARLADAALPDTADLFLHAARGTYRGPSRSPQADDRR